MCCNCKKIIHIFPRSIFLRNYLEFINEYSPNECHVFITYGKDHSDTLPYPECIKNYCVLNIQPIYSSWCYSSFFSLKLLHLINSGNLVIFHCFPPLFLNIGLFFPKILKKSIWVIWGHDIDDYHPRSPKLFSKYFFHCYYLVKSRITLRIGHVVSRIPEYEVVKRYYNPSAVNHPLPALYPPLLSNAHISELGIINSNEIGILLGHSSFAADNHLNLIDILKKYSNNNIHLYVPLAYGDGEYAIKVREKAISVFGYKKVTILSNVMDYGVYREFIRLNVQIGILDSLHQFGLGTIYLLLSLGKKVYLNDEGLNKKIVDKMGYITYPSSFLSLPSTSIFDLVFMEERDRDHNIHVYVEQMNFPSIGDAWNEIFNINVD